VIICILSRKIAQMTLLEELKKQSSKWIKTKGQPYSDFYWQSGYGIFSVNPTETDIVVNYIINQEEHHKKVTFQDEYRAFLKKYNVEYDERYVGIKTWLSPIQGSINRTLIYRALTCADDLRLSAFTKRY
jgi:putative transposase